MSDISVRLMRREDRDRVAEIYLRGRRHAFTWVPAGRFALDDLEADTTGEVMFVAERGGRVAGFAALWTPDAFLHHLYVDPAEHRRGIGRALMRQVMAVAVRPVELKCQSNNRAAFAFYLRLGFVPQESGVSDIGPWERFRAPAIHEPLALVPVQG